MKAHNSKHSRARALLKHGLWVGLLLASSSTSLRAQTPAWQPNRLPSSPSMQPLGNNAVAQSGNATANTAVSSTANPPNGEQGNSGVVLRWRTSARVHTDSQPAINNHAGASAHSVATSTSSASSSLAARAYDANAGRQPASSAAGMQTAGYSAVMPSSSPAALASGNPLRSTSVVSSNTRQGSVSAPTFVPRGTHSGQRNSVQPANFQAPVGDAPQAPPTLQLPGNFPPVAPPQDALTLPEDAPAPPVAPPANQDNFPRPPDLSIPPAQDINPAEPMPDSNNDLRLPDSPPKDDDSTNPFKNRSGEELESPSDLESARRSRDLEKKKDTPDASANCESFRDKLRNSSITKIDLNAAPRYGQGMDDDPEKSEKQRLDFASSSEVRDWCDRHGRSVVQGRMIDLVNEQVVLDINGVRREIPLRDLCDVDLAYVGKVWHLPVSCGSGYEQVAGRSFVPSAIQWKASGLCHKPLYFEEVQLERYGHEIGPILQPLVSTAHFFGNIAVLPYKMGIHPPHECQYSLGYYRPGDCAPYMLPPVPISLRGAAAQAGVVIGGAALLP